MLSPRRRQNPSTSSIFAFAADLREQMLTDYRDVQQAQYDTAVEATNGHLVNARGAGRGWTSWNVMWGPDTVLRAYASEELAAHLASHPRTTRTTFEAQWLEVWLNGQEVDDQAG